MNILYSSWIISCLFKYFPVVVPKPLKRSHSYSFLPQLGIRTVIINLVSKPWTYIKLTGEISIATIHLMDILKSSFRCGLLSMQEEWEHVLFHPIKGKEPFKDEEPALPSLRLLQYKEVEDS